MEPDLQTILAKLDADEQKKVLALLNAAAMQGELIRDLSHDLVTYEGAATLQREALRSESLAALAEKLGGKFDQGPTVREINQAVAQMREDIKTANSGQEAFQAVFGFALKMAPLFL